MSSDIGTGTTMSFGTQLWAPAIISIGDIGSEGSAVQTTHLSTSDARTYMAGRLVENGTIAMEVQHDPDLMPTVGGANETITITFYDGTTCSFDGFVLSHKISNVNTEESALMTAAVQVKVSGEFTWS